MAQSAVADATAAGLETAAAEGLTSLSATFAEKGLLDQAEAEAEKAVKIASERGARRTLAWARLQLAEALRLQGHQGNAIAIVDDVLPFLRKNRYRRFELFALLIAARAHDQLGQLEQSRQMSSDVLAMADTLHDDGRAAIAASDLARVTALLGQYHDALALRERAEATYRRLGDELALPYALGNHAELLIRLGRRADANRVLAELEAGIERGIEAYVGRTRRAAFLRGFSAATALRCEEALRDLSKVSLQPGGNEQTSVVAPGVTAFCEARVGRPATLVPPVPSDSDAADIAERAYWLAMAGLARNDLAASGVAAAEGLTALGSLANDELRWRLAALASVANRSSANRSAAAGRLEDARTALDRVRRAFAGDAASYDARPDLVYVRKLAELM